MKEKNTSKEYKYVRGFSSISISGICRKLKINRSNIMSGRSKNEKYVLVKEEIEKEIAKLYLGE